MFDGQSRLLDFMGNIWFLLDALLQEKFVNFEET